jgi:probable selenium-dependent hydroxylase accessory protein YqeC
MWYVRKIDPFDSLVHGKFIAFVGGGGKTSLSEYLGAEAVKRGKRAALVTTTKIWAREPYATMGGGGWHGTDKNLIHVGKTVEGNKLTGLDMDEVAAIGADFDVVLIEADGSKSLPLKYPAEFEPVIPGFSDRVVVVAGLDGLGGRIDETVFRWKLFTETTGFPGDDGVSNEVLLRLFESDAMMKGVDPRKCSIFLNKYDACRRREEIPGVARALHGRCSSAVLFGSTRFGFFYGLNRVVTPQGGCDSSW